MLVKSILLLVAAFVSNSRGTENLPSSTEKSVENPAENSENSNDSKDDSIFSLIYCELH